MHQIVENSNRAKQIVEFIISKDQTKVERIVKDKSTDRTIIQPHSMAISGRVSA